MKIFFSVILLFLGLVSGAQAALGDEASKQIDFTAVNEEVLAKYIHYLTNWYRKQYQLAPLQYDRDIEAVAKGHSEDMMRYRFFSHQSPVFGRWHFKDRFAQAGIRSRRLAENIITAFGYKYEPGTPLYFPAQTGRGYRYQLNGTDLPPHSYRSLAEEIVSRWMQSPSHRDNILDGRLQYQGIGIAVGKDSSFGNMPKFYVTQNFTARIVK